MPTRRLPIGIPPVGPSVTSSDISHYFGAVPGLDLSKRTNQIDANTPPGPSILAGQPVEWTYVLVSTGNVTLSNIVVRDDNGTPANIGDDFDACVVSALAPQGSHTCTRSGTAHAGQYTNIAVASASPPVGPTISDTDPSSYFGVNPALTLEVRTNEETADSPPGPVILAGGQVAWRYDVQNTGNVALSSVIIEDDAGTPANTADDVVVCTISSLAVGASQSCNRSGTAIVGQYANVGRAPRHTSAGQ